jgi:hypothetical protein
LRILLRLLLLLLALLLLLLLDLLSDLFLLLPGRLSWRTLPLIWPEIGLDRRLRFRSCAWRLRCSRWWFLFIPLLLQLFPLLRQRLSLSLDFLALRLGIGGFGIARTGAG